MIVNRFYDLKVNANELPIKVNEILNELHANGIFTAQQAAARDERRPFSS
jgi:hypothetical protein